MKSSVVTSGDIKQLHRQLNAEFFPNQVQVRPNSCEALTSLGHSRGPQTARFTEGEQFGNHPGGPSLYLPLSFAQGSL